MTTDLDLGILEVMQSLMGKWVVVVREVVYMREVICVEWW